MRAGSHVLPACKRLAQTLLMLAVFIFLGLVISPSKMYEASFFQAPYPYKVFYLIACLHITIAQLFTAFIFGESITVAAGLGYSVSENEKKIENFNSIRTMEMVKFETATSVYETTQFWNMQSHHYLKYYVSLRLKNRSLPRGTLQVTPLLLTYLISGVWHGLDLGYFFFFLGLGLLDVLGRTFQSTELAHQLNERVHPVVRKAVLWVWHFFALSYLATGFIVLDYEKFNMVHAAVGHTMHYAIPLGILTSILLPKHQTSKPSLHQKTTAKKTQ